MRIAREFPVLAALLLAACGGPESEPPANENAVTDASSAEDTAGAVDDPIASKNGVEIVDGWVRAVTDRSITAAFATIQSADLTDDVLLSVTSPAAGATELHESIIDGDRRSMRPVETIAIPMSGAVLKPGGNHIMLIDLVDQSLEPGDDVELIFTFQDAGELVTFLPVAENAEGAAAAIAAMKKAHKDGDHDHDHSGHDHDHDHEDHDHEDHDHDDDGSH